MPPGIRPLVIMTLLVREKFLAHAQDTGTPPGRKGACEFGRPSARRR
jgi:hypothetical protein